MSDDSSHDWVRSRLAAWSVGLTNDTTSRDIETHLSQCEACRQQADEIRGGEFSSDDGGAHLPASLIALWDRRAPELEGLTRELVRRHLGRCELCREELRTLGHTASLEALLASTDDRRSDLAVDDHHARGRVLRLPGRASWWTKSGGLQVAWFGALTAAAALLIVFGSGTWKRPGVERVAVAPEMPPIESLAVQGGFRAYEIAPPASVPVGPLESPAAEDQEPLAVRPDDEPPGLAEPLREPTESPGPESPSQGSPVLLALGPDDGSALNLPGAVRGSGRDPSAGGPASEAPQPKASAVQVRLIDDGGQTRELTDPNTIRDKEWLKVNYADFTGHKPRLAVVVAKDNAMGDRGMWAARILNPVDVEGMVRQALEATHRFAIVERAFSESGSPHDVEYVARATIIELNPEKDAKSIKAINSEASSNATRIGSVGVSGTVAFCRLDIQIIDARTGAIAQNMTVDGTAKSSGPNLGGGAIGGGLIGGGAGIGSRRAASMAEAMQACANKIAYTAATKLTLSQERPVTAPSGDLKVSGGEVRIRPPASIALHERSSRVEVNLVDGAGRVVQTLTTSVAALFPSGQRQAIVLRRDEGGLVPGPYILEFVVVENDLIVAREELRFSIE